MSQNFRITTSSDGSRQFSNRGGVTKGRRWNNRIPKSNVNRGPINPDSIRKLLDADINMDSGPTGNFQNMPTNKNNNANHRGQSRRSRGRNNYMNGGVFKRLGLPINHNVNPNKQEWFLITILHARDLDRKFILESLTSHSKVPFVPISFSKEENSAFFYVKRQQEAFAIRDLNKLIVTPSGFKMIILMRKSSAPSSQITNEVIEQFKTVMSKRYNAEISTLNLTDFAKDAEFIHNEVLLDMNDSPVIHTILDIIVKNIPTLKALDLSNNNLLGLDSFLKLHEKAPNIEKISLANNKVQNERDIYYISKLPIIELILEGNPFCERFKEKQQYISSVRKCFPKVLKLDKQLLPAPITFEVESAVLPDSKGSFFENPAIQNQICIFLQQYFNFYDSDSNRSNLMGAYHDKAIFSLTANYNKYSSNKQASLNEYFSLSRNLKEGQRQNNMDKVMVGRESIISLLMKLPSSQHDMKSLLVDTKYICPTMLLISINGVFKERKSKSHSLSMRTFSKVLITVPNGPGIAIINEMLNISCLPSDQTKKYFNENNELSSSGADIKPLINDAVNNTAMSNGITPNSEIMQAMVKQLSAITRMNETYSQMCLSENNWDYQLAMQKFTVLHQSNSIPQEAFL